MYPADATDIAFLCGPPGAGVGRHHQRGPEEPAVGHALHGHRGAGVPRGGGAPAGGEGEDA